jgi:hypothetical protein
METGKSNLGTWLYHGNESPVMGTRKSSLETWLCFKIVNGQTRRQML